MKRREFLKSAVGAAALSANFGPAYGQNAPSGRVRVAVMGCHAKGRGFTLLKTLAGLPGVEVATVCDVDSRAMDAASAEILKRTEKAPKKEKDLRRVLEDKEIDGVLCAAPDHWHAPAALMTMQAGKSIYVEKPCSYNPGEGEMLVDAAAKYKAIFQMGNQRRSSDVFQSVVKEIHGGLIGTPRFARCWYASMRPPIGKGNTVAAPEWLDWDLWQGPAPRRQYLDNVVHYNWHWFYHWGTGECGNNAPHFVDVARWALKAVFPNRVTSAGGRLFHEGDDWQWFDTQSATFEFPNRVLITWEGLSSVKARPYENLSTGCMIYGLDGAVLFRPNDTCALFDKNGKEVREWNAKNLAGDATDRANPTGNLDAAHLGDWARCIREKDVKTRTPADESHASILLTHLANIAARTGETVKLDPATGRLAKGSAGAELWQREYAKGWEMKV
ncbi:MAG: Gfo/Idh/MocA family oxidoreductase [Kiritimatiellae bacterium]|nr:Gfo/Idh/MocA family oxidoreductase [Kiritimatiellia bacterium]